MNELMTIEEFFEQNTDLINRYVGRSVVVKIVINNCGNVTLKRCTVFEKVLFEALCHLRDRVYVDGGWIWVNIYPFMFDGVAIKCHAGFTGSATISFQRVLLLGDNVICSLQPYRDRSPQMHVVP